MQSTENGLRLFIEDGKGMERRVTPKTFANECVFGSENGDKKTFEVVALFDNSVRNVNSKFINIDTC
jgi:hypothetical protein